MSEEQTAETIESEENSLELVIFTSTEDMSVAPIVFNKEQLKGSLEVVLVGYKEYEVTEDNLIEAKAKRAKLNKLSKAMNDKGRHVQQSTTQPVKKFRDELKDLINMVDKASKIIDDQVKVFEEKSAEEKQTKIKVFWKQNAGDLFDLIKLSQISKDTWSTKGQTLKKIEKQIIESITKINEDLELLDSLESEHLKEIKLVYVKDLNLAQALKKDKELKAEKQRLEDFEAKKAEAKALADAKAEEERIEQEAKEKIVEDAQAVHEAEIERFNAVEGFIDEPEPEAEQRRILRSSLRYKEPLTKRKEFWFDLTKEKQLALQKCCKENDIEYGLVER